MVTVRGGLGVATLWGMVLTALIIGGAVSLVFWLGRWRGRAELLGDVPMSTSIRVRAGLDASGDMHVLVNFQARTEAITITGEKGTVVSRDRLAVVFPKVDG